MYSKGKHTKGEHILMLFRKPKYIPVYVNVKEPMCCDPMNKAYVSYIWYMTSIRIPYKYPFLFELPLRQLGLWETNEAK